MQFGEVPQALLAETTPLQYQTPFSVHPHKRPSEPRPNQQVLAPYGSPWRLTLPGTHYRTISRRGGHSLHQCPARRLLLSRQNNTRLPNHTVSTTTILYQIPVPIDAKLPDRLVSLDLPQDHSSSRNLTTAVRPRPLGASKLLLPRKYSEQASANPSAKCLLLRSPNL